MTGRSGPSTLFLSSHWNPVFFPEAIASRALNAFTRQEWGDAGRGDAAFHGTGRFRDHRDTQPFVDSSNPHVRLDTTRTHPRLPTPPETQTSRLEIIDATAAADDARRVVCPPAVGPPFLSNIQL